MMSEKFDDDITIKWILTADDAVKKRMIKSIIDKLSRITDLQDVKSMCDQRIFALDSVFVDESLTNENHPNASEVSEKLIEEKNDELFNTGDDKENEEPTISKCCSALIDTLENDFEEMWSNAKQEIYNYNHCSGVELEKFKKLFDYAIDDIDSDHTFTYKTWYLEAKKHFKSSARQMNVRSSHSPKLIDDCLKAMNEIADGLDQLSVTCDHLIQKSLHDCAQTEISGEILSENFYSH